MKIHIDIDCTPDEARTLFGLPDVKPMQQALMAEIEVRMKKYLAAMEPQALIGMWLPAGIQSIDEWRKFLLSKMPGFTNSDKAQEK
jgi:hypothetical protein